MDDVTRELIRRVKEANDVTLHVTPLTNRMQITRRLLGDGETLREWIVGPFHPQGSEELEELTILLKYESRTPSGYQSIQFIVMDCEGDVVNLTHQPLNVSLITWVRA